MSNPRNAGDVPTEPVLRFIGQLMAADEYVLGATIFEGYENSIQNAMPEGTLETVARAKMRRLYRKGFVDGCLCGCRGDFTLTEDGWHKLERYHFSW